MEKNKWPDGINPDRRRFLRRSLGAAALTMAAAPFALGGPVMAQSNSLPGRSGPAPTPRSARSSRSMPGC
jgi:hypothetical protein